jgi:hypothetical protein
VRVRKGRERYFYRCVGPAQKSTGSMLANRPRLLLRIEFEAPDFGKKRSDFLVGRLVDETYLHLLA